MSIPLKTTAEQRARLAELYRQPGPVKDLLADLATLLAENARLQMENDGWQKIVEID